MCVLQYDRHSKTATLITSASSASVRYDFVFKKIVGSAWRNKIASSEREYSINGTALLYS